MLIRLPDGSLRGIAMVGVTYLAADGAELPPGAYTGDGRYAITLEVRDAAIPSEVPRRKP
jgi:hypothetical protein